MRRFESRIVHVFYVLKKCCGERTTQHAARHRSNQARTLNKLRVFTVNALRRVAVRCGAVSGVNEPSGTLQFNLNMCTECVYYNHCIITNIKHVMEPLRYEKDTSLYYGDLARYRDMSFYSGFITLFVWFRAAE